MAFVKGNNIVMKTGYILLALLLAVGISAPAFAKAEHTNPIQLSAEEKAYFWEIKTLRVLTMPAWQPYSYHGKGLSIDMLEDLCEASGITLVKIEAADYEDAERRLAKGEAELSAVKFDLAGAGEGVVPYLRAPIHIVTHQDAQLNDTSKLIVGFLSDIDFLDTSRYGDRVKPVSLASVADCIYAVRSRTIDFFACDFYMLSPFVHRLGVIDLMSVAVPQHDVTIGFGVAKGTDARLISALQKTRESYTTGMLSDRLQHHRLQDDAKSKIIDFVYQNPFSLLCAVFSLFFVVLMAMFVYTRVRLGHHQELRGYEHSYRMLADTFGEAGMEYDFLQDRLTIFGEQHGRLDLPETVEQFHKALEKKELRISLTPECFDALLGNNTPGRSYEAELQCGMKEGDWNWFRMIYVVVCTSESHRRPIRLIGCLVNIEAEHQEKERLLQIGNNDQLTGLLNRAAAQEQAKAALAQSKDLSLLFFFDIDHFKLFNDQHGHFCGDAVLRALGEAMREAFQEDAIACRWGGDEFLILLKGGGVDPRPALARFQAMQAYMRKFTYLGEDLPVRLSVGGVVAEPGIPFDDLLKLADETLYAVKNSGRDNVMLIASGPALTEGKAGGDEADT